MKKFVLIPSMALKKFVKIASIHLLELLIRVWALPGNRRPRRKRFGLLRPHRCAQEEGGLGTYLRQATFLPGILGDGLG
jgi:hypothetical protein